MKKILSWVYLLWLNAAYYVLQLRFLGKVKNMEFYEKKKLLIGASESSQACINEEELINRLSAYDVISFDIFDTLILRPFSQPSDLFYLIGNELSYLDFKGIRIQAEKKAREKEYQRSGSYEIGLADIWEQLEIVSGISAQRGMKAEMDSEIQFCYANTFMQHVYKELKGRGKRIIFTTDMYLPEGFIRRLLIRKGYDGTEDIFLSCAYKVSKRDGRLYDCIKNALGRQLCYAHVGDNWHSDIKMAQNRGFTAFLYPNCNQNAEKYRCYDMSPIIGSAYRGLVNNRIYCGSTAYSLSYEYGYLYGGLFAVGYCHFIHRYCKRNGIDKVLFLSRDGDILKKVYALLYPQEKTEYIYWSRFAAVKLAAQYMKHDYLQKLVMYKGNKGIQIQEILRSMELSELAAYLPQAGIHPSHILCDRNMESLIEFINLHWQEVLEIYRPQREAAQEMISQQIGNSSKAAAVDIGWAGSGALALDALVQQEWKLPCQIIGIVAGTNTASNAEPDMSESFLLCEKLVSYLYSSAHNRDLWKKHDPAKNYNVYWELLTSSAEPSFQGYYKKEDGETELRFLMPEGRPDKIKEIQQGILDFAGDYNKAFYGVKYMENISGRDAYAPMLLASSYKERYLKEAVSDFNIRIDVGA